jgi:hypothetical protein
MVVWAGKKNITKDTMTSLWDTTFWKENVEKMHFCPSNPMAEEEDEGEETEKGNKGAHPKIVYDKFEAAKHVYHSCFVGDSTNTSIWTDYKDPNSIYAEYMRMNINFYKMKGL